MTQTHKSQKIDTHGRFFQTPNLPIIIWSIGLVFAKITGGQWHSFFATVSFGALFTWAWLEIFYGTNKFRRGLGLVVVTVAILNRV